MYNAYAKFAALEQASEDLKVKYRQACDIIMDGYLNGNLPRFTDNNRTTCKELLIQANELFIRLFEEEMVQKNGRHRVAVYGGSFDPPTLGHIMVVSHLLLNDPDIDSVLIIPCFQQNGKSLSRFEHRYQMCRQAFEWLPRTTVSKVEESLGGISYTSRTLRHLQAYNPHWKMRFVIGSDLKDSIRSWEGYETIEQLAPPVIVGRAGIPVEGGPTPICPVVSSTLVRKALVEGHFNEAERYLPGPVLRYIQRYGLYRPLEASSAPVDGGSDAD